MIARRNGEDTTLDCRHDSNESVNRRVRYKQILEVLAGGELTAKEIAYWMCEFHMIPTAERNYAAPRLTELSKAGIVEPCGKRKCRWTGKTVTVYRKRASN